MVTLAPDDLGVLRRSVAALEEAGVDAVGIGDSPGYHDPYVALCVTAQATSRVSLGPMVTNVLTRHPRVTAGALRSLDELAPGRVFVGLGSGDSALAGTGTRPAPLAALRDGVVTLRDALAGATGRRRVRLFLTANGPRTVELGGALADAVVSGTGVEPGALHRARSAVQAGARGAGRGDDVPLWVVTRVAFGRDSDDAARKLLPLLASGANHVFRVPAEMASLPEETGHRVKQLLDAYDYSAHGRRDRNPNAELVERLGLVDALASRFALAGAPADIADGICRLAQHGVGGVVIPAVGLDVDELVDHLGRDVLPAVRARLGA